MKDAGSFDADLAVNMQFTVDSAGLVEMAKTVKEISKGKDLQNYWKDVESAIDNAASAIKKYSKNINEKGLAENFLKQINALKALTKKENLSEIFPNMDVNFDELINSAKRLAPKINSEFSSNKFEQAFKTFDLLKEKGIDLGEAFRELSEYANLVDRNFRLNRENSELKNLIGDDDIEQIKKNLKEIQKLRQEAEDTFSSFLNINKIEKTDSWGDENFSEYFTEIRNGTLSATEAIGRFKVEYGHLLENGYKSSGDSFGLDQLQAFSTKLDSIFRQVEETSNKINDILSNGVIAKSVQNLSKDTTLPDSQRSIFGNILQDEESLKSITALFQKLIDETNQTKNTEVFNTEQFTKIESLFTSIESSLSSIKGVLVDVGDGEELSPLLKNINNVETAIDKLSSSVKGIGLNMNIDFGSNKELEAKAEAKISNALQAYQKLFEHLKLSSAGGSVINTKFFDFDINQFDTPMSKLQAYVKFIKDMREEAKQMFGGQDVLYTDTDKKIWDQASSAKGQVTKIFNEMKTANDTNPLENLFGKTDLSGVIEQLNTIVSKLDEISVSTKGFVETFKNGLNVNASVEEIEKLTNRVKELEDELAEVKVPIALPSEESNISSGRKDAFPNANSTASVEKIADGFKEIKQNTEQATEATEKYQRVLSQVGEFGVDAKVSAMYQRNDGQLESVSWKAKRDDQGQILYDKNGNIDYDFNSTVISKYEQLEKIITTADNKLLDLQKSLKDTQNLNSNASTKNIEEQIQYQKDYIQLLEQTVKAISQQDEYLLYEQQIIDARAKAEKEYNLNQGTKSDISNAKQLASDEQKRQKSIEQTNRLLNKQQIIIDGIEKSYSKAANNDLDKAVNSQSDLAELEKKKNLIQFLLNGLKNEDRNSSNEKEFLQVEKLIAEYKQLAKDKLKANNSSKQELGGQELDVLLANQVTQYNKLISQSEKYGDATKEITNELKVQRDLIAEQDKNGVYVARSKKADGSEITANDYYNARDNYKISKSIFSSYETVRKEASELQAIAEAKKKSRQLDKEATQNSVDNALKDQLTAWKSILSIREKINSTSDVHEIEVLKQVKSEYQQNYIEADKILKTNSDLYDKETQLAKLEQIRIEANNKITSSQEKQISSYENKLSTYQAKKDTYDATIARFNDGGWTSDTYLKNVQAVKDAVKKYEDLLSDIKAKGGIASEEDIQNLKEYEAKIKDTIATVTNMSAAEKGYNFVSAQKELDKIHKLLNENSKMSSEAKNKIRAYYAEIESGNPSMSLDRIHGEIMKIYNAEVEAGRAGRSFFDTLKNSGFHQLAAQMAGMFGVYDVINVVRQGVNTVRELDEAMTEVHKVSNATETQYASFRDTISSTAKEIATTNKELLNSSADFLRLGYSLDQASDLAKNATLFVNVGDGVDITEATEDMITAMKAFDIQAKDSIKIVDDYNQIGNQFALSASDIGEAMKRSASALETGNNNFEQSIGLITAMNEIVQNSENTGNSLKVLSLRLRGAKAELEDMQEDTDGLCDSTSKLREQIMSLTGVDIMLDDNTFKSTTDIIKELGAVWDKLSDSSQAATLELIAGKSRANNVAALLKNYQRIDEVMESLGDAEGSAMRENEAIVDSINGRIKVLSATAEEFWKSFIDTDLVKNTVSLLSDMLNILTQIIDKGGALATLGIGGTGVGIGAFIKNFSWLTKSYKTRQSFLVG